MTTPEEAEQKRQSVAQALRERREVMCDKYTVQWVQRQLAEIHQEVMGFVRILLRHGNDLLALEGRSSKLEARLKALEEAVAEKDAIIGELRVDNMNLNDIVAKLETRIDDMSRWATEIHKWALSKGMPKTTDSKGQS